MGRERGREWEGEVEGKVRKGRGRVDTTTRAGKILFIICTFTQNDNNPPFEYSVYKGNVKINVKLYQEQ